MTRVPTTFAAMERESGERPSTGDRTPLNVLRPVQDGLTSLPAPASNQSRNRLHYLEALASASHAINAFLDQDKVAGVLVEKAADLLQVTAASVMLLDLNGDVRIRAFQGLSPAYVQSQRQPLEQSIAGRALAEKRVFATWDVRQTADEAAREAAKRENITSVACAPMLSGGRAVGALNLYCREEHCFSEDQLYVLALLAAQGAVAITNAQLYRDSRAHAAEVRASFRRVGAALAASLDRTETLRLIVQLSVEMTRADGGAMFMRAGEPPSDGFLLSAARGLDRHSVRQFQRVDVSPIAARALAERRIIAIPDTRRYPDIPFPFLRLPGDKQAPPCEARSLVCVPVLVGERPVGVLNHYACEPNHFKRDDIHLLSSFALQAAVAIENARLYAQERNVAQTLQRSFLPELPEHVDGFQIGRVYAPANEAASVGGDTYDLFALSDGRIAVVIADVCGKGTLAATLTAMAKYTTRAYALENPHPGRVLARVNDALVPQTDDSTFMTLCYAVLDGPAGSVSLASAAHPPVLLCRGPGARCQALASETGLIAGFRTGEAYPTETVAIGQGDVLVFYTDGVIEARRRKTMFGIERLEKVIEQNAASNAQEIANAIHTAVTNYTEILADDVALLVLKTL